MVEDRITDGRRIAQLLASELEGREDGELARFSVADADRDVEPTEDGARAYDISHDGDRLAQVFVHPDRTRIVFEVGPDAALEAAKAVDLRARPKATTSPRTLVFVESGGAVKRATDVLEEVSREIM
ncbi:hypothetical protein ACYJ1Y_02750 [Natrialbaceae archaeon A-gly3]